MQQQNETKTEAAEEPAGDNQDLRPDWLKNLTEKAWNLELIVSGAATFIALELPGLTDSLLYNYQQHWSLQEGLTGSMLPYLALCFARVIAWALPAAFFIHFIMRAFWVGLVGLHTVFPAGIRYEHLPSQIDYTRRMAEKKFGRLSDYIQRLDRQCNQIFALAFIIALFGMATGIVYLIIFFFTNLLPLQFGFELKEEDKTALMIFFVGVSLLIALLYYAVKGNRLDQWPILKKIAERAIGLFPIIFVPIAYRPLTYLNMTFSSNISKRKFYTAMLVISLMFYVGLFFSVFQVFGKMKGVNTYSFRSFYASSFENAYTLATQNYDESRGEGEHPGLVSIPSEVISGPFLKVFVAYPKWLDASLRQHCSVPSFQDSLPRAYWRMKGDSLRAECFHRLLQVRVNDSLYDVRWVFQAHADKTTLGVAAFIPTNRFRFGQNILSIKVPSAAKSDSIRTLGSLPFWFAE